MYYIVKLTVQKHGEHWNVEEDYETGEAEAKVEEGLGSVVADVEEQTTDNHSQEYVERYFEIHVVLQSKIFNQFASPVVHFEKLYSPCRDRTGAFFCDTAS